MWVFPSVFISSWYSPICPNDHPAIHVESHVVIMCIDDTRFKWSDTVCWTFAARWHTLAVSYLWRDQYNRHQVIFDWISQIYAHVNTHHILAHAMHMWVWTRLPTLRPLPSYHFRLHAKWGVFICFDCPIQYNFHGQVATGRTSYSVCSMLVLRASEGLKCWLMS